MVGPSGEEYEDEPWTEGLNFEECIDNVVLQECKFLSLSGASWSELGRQ